MVAGNWKMNLTIQEAKMLAINLTEEISNRPNSDVDILVCPPFPYISAVSEIISEHNKILTGAQNCATHASGAYTGEVSATMLASMNVGHVIIGHSERRAFYQEDDTILLEKLHQVLAAGIKPIFCCGETLQEREKNTQRDVIKNQLRNTLFELNESDFSKVVIAYEPVWAIGTGLTATSEQAQEIHAFIRQLLEEKFGSELAGNCSILYGGSCNASNAAELFSNPDVDGGLIGGASLKAKDFIQIVYSFPQ
jgi:triosephosphate isomerase